MKYLAALIVALALMFLMMSCASSKRLYDATKPIYQGKIFKKEVQMPPKKIDWKIQHQIKMSSKGQKLIWWGAIALALGIGASCAFENKLVDTIGAFVGFTGTGLMVIGMIMMKVVEYWAWIGVAMLVVAIIAAVVYFRDKGLKLPTKKAITDKITRTKKKK